jgi:hypothetical protein
MAWGSWNTRLLSRGTAVALVLGFALAGFVSMEVREGGGEGRYHERVYDAEQSRASRGLRVATHAYQGAEPFAMVPQDISLLAIDILSED